MQGNIVSRNLLQAMSKPSFDFIVIGSGPAGEGAAMQAAKACKSVALVERYKAVGGGCVHWGTIPSKVLRHGVQRLLEIKTNPLFGAVATNLEIGFQDLLSAAATVVQKQVTLRHSFYNRNGLALHSGAARFEDAHTVVVTDGRGNEELLTAENIVIATGSRPYRPGSLDFSHPRIFDSDTILSLSYTPRSISIYGAGVIGCEYASIFRSLGIKVNLINQREKLLSFLDDEIVDALSYHLREQGVVIRHLEEYESLETLDDGVVIHLKSGKKLKTDILLWANGRTGNSQGMALEKVNVEPDHRGHIPVDEGFRTAMPNIVAAGDVIGPPALASASYDQGRAAVQFIVQGSSELSSNRTVPSGIYTSPEISCIGRSERELTDAKVPYEVGHAQFRSLARAQITGQTVGMLKILFHRETLAVLGIHCFGDQASEIIHIGQAVMSSQGNSLRYFVNTTFNYPTMAEAYRVAALNGMNRLF